jgi:hypothetical protein
MFLLAMHFIQLTNYISEMCHTQGSTNPLVWSFVTGVKSRLTRVTMKIHVSWDLYTVSNGTWLPTFKRAYCLHLWGHGNILEGQKAYLVLSHRGYRITLSRGTKRPTWTLTSSSADVVSGAIPTLPQMPSRQCCLHKRRGNSAVTSTFT